LGLKESLGVAVELLAIGRNKLLRRNVERNSKSDKTSIPGHVVNVYGRRYTKTIHSTDNYHRYTWSATEMKQLGYHGFVVP
jgi:hypothetical protein